MQQNIKMSIEELEGQIEVEWGKVRIYLIDRLGTIHILRQHNFGPTHLLNVLSQHKHSTERQQHWQFSRTTHPVVCLRNIWILP